MKIIIDILLLVIIALCTWNGYKRGLVGGVAGILAIIIALFGSSLLSSAYAHEVVPALEPFVDGYILAQDSSLRYDYAYECMINVGFYEKRADTLASRAVAVAEENNCTMTQAVVSVLCDTTTYVGAMVIAFLLILIFLVAIGNVGNLSFRLPNMEALDEVGGAVLGFAKAFLYCVLLCWLLSFLGAVIGRDTMERTTLGRFFLIFDFLTNSLM